MSVHRKINYLCMGKLKKCTIGMLQENSNVILLGVPLNRNKLN